MDQPSKCVFSEDVTSERTVDAACAQVVTAMAAFDTDRAEAAAADAQRLRLLLAAEVASREAAETRAAEQVHEALPLPQGLEQFSCSESV